MAGYHGYSMSNNAVAAYEAGEMPRSKWTKEAVLAYARSHGFSDAEVAVLRGYPASELKTALRRSSWHHTSSRYNRTDFYEPSASALEAMASRPYSRQSASERRSKETPAERRVEAEWAVWGGTRAHPRIERWEADTGTVRGDWFFPDHSASRHKVSGGYFRIKSQEPPSGPTPRPTPRPKSRPVMKRFRYLDLRTRESGFVEATTQESAMHKVFGKSKRLVLKRNNVHLEGDGKLIQIGSITMG